LENLDHAQILALAERLQKEISDTSANPTPAHLVASQQRKFAQPTAQKPGQPPLAQDVARGVLVGMQTSRESSIRELVERVKINNIGIQPKPSPPPSSVKAEGFFSRFPGARNVKLGA